MKVGLGYDSHRFAEGRKLFLGGVEIPHEKGLLGHSDADVLIHAVADAILGAAGEGDIGSHFPDTDPSYKDMPGITLLKAVNDMVTRKRYEIVHIDATIVMEQPRIRDYVPRMRITIAGALAIGIGQVNIKVKSNEGMGWIGRGEGAASCAAATVRNKAA